MRIFQESLISYAVHESLRDWKAVTRGTDGTAPLKVAKTACWVRWRTAAGKKEKVWKRREDCRGGSCPDGRRTAWKDGWAARNPVWMAGSPPDG